MTARTAWLANAYPTLDAAVLDACGWPVDLPGADLPPVEPPDVPLAAEDPAPYH